MPDSTVSSLTPLDWSAPVGVWPLRDSLARQLRPYGQEHLLAFWDQLAPEEQRNLAAEISSIDFAALSQVLRSEPLSENWALLSERAVPPPAIRLGVSNERLRKAAALEHGQAALRAGKVAAVLVAGGQGTRLGFPHPKGMFPIGPVSGASLFQILLEQLLAVTRRFETRIPLYLMTSPATHAETVAYLEAQQRFGLPTEDVHVFCQGTMPAVDALSGRVLLESRHQLALSPDGHGGMLPALAASGGLDDLARRGIEQMFYFQVDNPLVRVCDPEFLGYHLLAESEASTQVVAKREPLERVGNVVSVDGRMRIIEYSDLPEHVARRRSADGRLDLWAGSIAVHVFDVPFLSRMAESRNGMPFHFARKAVPTIDAAGRNVTPSAPNAIKLERFIFDLLPEARRTLAVEVDAASCFAPVKNAPGAASDAPEHAQRAMGALARRWLTEAGAEIAHGIPIEISPMFAQDAEEYRQRIRPGTRFSAPTYLR